MGELMKDETQAIQVAPWMHVITPDAGLNLDQLLPASGIAYVARLNGEEMPDESCTFEKFRETLKFPDYFGWNWHAFYDCLRDLQWLSSDYHILILESAEYALSEDDAAREELFKSLYRAGQRWAYTKRPEGITLSKFHVVLSCAEGAASTVANGLVELQKQT
ncbi:MULTISPECIES: barstar family protein [unclassified Streptomyces]|uniref:barstar family protein n=1 Tax=unclassified Streptomyces TaxID=2593676 RepID=UPI00381E9FE9|nr:barstar family protein [Streptomyces sp. NBC_01177]WSS67722.1 barstar family protein [Streptomyces sp. NBC_01175]WSS74714.1 barstar family protein [Streptomyces sp. NBC_01174]